MVVISFGLLCVLSAVLAWIDIRDGIIPDWLNLTIAGVGLLMRAVIADGPLPGSEALCEARPSGRSSGY
jgi:leader peptidase (prepilin peptidase) / N-methyltransferase